MSYHFTLCESCLAKYRLLRFDPTAIYTLNLMPFCSLEWIDEHPKSGSPLGRWDPDKASEDQDLSIHDSCRESVIRLVDTRTKLWIHKTILEDREDLWKEALDLIPSWPGFQRLELTPQLFESLKGCFEEYEELMGAIREDFPEFESKDKGGGLTTFSATRWHTSWPVSFNIWFLLIGSIPLMTRVGDLLDRLGINNKNIHDHLPVGIGMFPLVAFAASYGVKKGRISWLLQLCASLWYLTLATYFAWVLFNKGDERAIGSTCAMAIGAIPCLRFIIGELGRRQSFSRTGSSKKSDA